MRDSKLIWYVVLAYLGQAIFRVIEWQLVNPSPILSLILDTVAVTTPTIAALLILSFGKKDLARAYINHTFHWRIGFKPYMLAFLPLLVYGIAFVIYLISDGQVTDIADAKTRLSTASPLLAPHFIVLLEWTKHLPLVIVPLVVLPVFAIVAGGQEEPGWRGYLLSRLQNSMNPVVASIAVGFIWAFWHLPLFLLPGYPQNDIPIVGYLLFIVPQSILLTWIYNKSQGSVIACMVYHGMFNAIGFCTIQLGYSGDVAPVEGIVIALNILIAIQTRGQLGRPHSL